MHSNSCSEHVEYLSSAGHITRHQIKKRVQQEMRKAKEHFEKKQAEVQLLQKKKKEAELLQRKKEVEVLQR